MSGESGETPFSKGRLEQAAHISKHRAICCKCEPVTQVVANMTGDGVHA